MKKKLDFVTNSSSCAFIFIGWVTDSTVQEMMEKFGTNKYDHELNETENLYEVYNGKVSISIGDYENGLPEDKVCIGICNRIHDDDYESHEYSIDSLMKIDKRLVENFNPKDIKIISGMEVC